MIVTNASSSSFFLQELREFLHICIEAFSSAKDISSLALASKASLQLDNLTNIVAQGPFKNTCTDPAAICAFERQYIVAVLTTDVRGINTVAFKTEYIFHWLTQPINKSDISSHSRSSHSKTHPMRSVFIASCCINK